MADDSDTVAFVADVHVANHRVFGGAFESGVNRRGKLVIDAMRRALDAARRSGASWLVVLGDLFDGVRPEAQLIAQLQDVIANRPAALEVLLLLGNHEMESTMVGDHSLAPLAFDATVIEKPTLYHASESVDLLLVPYQPGHASDWLPAVLKRLPSKGDQVRLLCMHMGVSDDETAPFLQKAHDSIPASVLAGLMAQHNIRGAFVGNWHDPRSWEIGNMSIEQVGTLVPVGFRDAGLEVGNVLTVRVSKSVRAGKALGISTIHIPGPRFIPLALGHKDAMPKFTSAGYAGNTLFVELRVPAGRMGEALEWKRNAIADGSVADARILPIQEELTKQARSAAARASSSTQLGNVLANFVERMDVEENVRRDRVVEHCRTYLGM